MNIGAGLAARKQRTCDHASRVTINSAGLEREICEACGHVSFKFEEIDRDKVERDQFARPTDDHKHIQR